MYAKNISFLVGNTNVYGIIFYQVYLLPWLTFPPFLSWYFGILVMLYFASGTLQHLYQGMKKYVVIGSMKIYCGKPSDNIIQTVLFVERSIKLVF